MVILIIMMMIQASTMHRYHWTDLDGEGRLQKPESGGADDKMILIIMILMMITISTML